MWVTVAKCRHSYCTSVFCGRACYVDSTFLELLQGGAAAAVLLDPWLWPMPDDVIVNGLTIPTMSITAPGFFGPVRGEQCEYVHEDSGLSQFTQTVEPRVSYTGLQYLQLLVSLFRNVAVFKCSVCVVCCNAVLYCSRWRSRLTGDA
jgi:hypothetical protein